jgi:hypothetical protein
MALTEPGRGAFANGARRRYDLDWLRVIAFGLLIFYHVGMFYVSWGWHVKSAYASPAAEWAMMLVNPWRLALLFFISGVAFRFASDKIPALALTRARVVRLGLPIAFGMAVAVAPQTYYELRQAGAVAPGYLAFWGDYLRLEQVFPMMTPTWNHLWYVVYLLAYSLLLAPFLPLLERFAKGPGERLVGLLTGGPVRVLTVVAVPFLIYRFSLDPQFDTTYDLVRDWANHAHRLTIFLIGYLVAKNARFWSAIDRALPWAAGILAALGLFMSHVWANWELVEARDPEWLVDVYRGLRIWFAWLAIATVLGAGQRWLDRPGPALRYLTEAVFPYYILHQTLIVAAGFHLTQLRLGAWTEFALVSAATVGGCALLHEFVIRRVPLLRPLFGLKFRPPAPPGSRAAPPTPTRPTSDPRPRAAGSPG